MAADALLPPTLFAVASVAQDPLDRPLDQVGLSSSSGLVATAAVDEMERAGAYDEELRHASGYFLDRLGGLDTLRVLGASA